MAIKVSAPAWVRTTLTPHTYSPLMMSSSNTKRLENARADFKRRQRKVQNELDPKVRQTYEAEFDR